VLEGDRRSSIEPVLANRRRLVAIAICAVGGTAVAWLATVQGAGVSPDSTVYLAAAASLGDGHGLVVPDWDGRLVALTHYPPLFPAVLAAFGRAGVALATAARVLNASLFAVTIALCALAVDRFSRPVSRTAIVVAAVVASSLDLLTVHAMVWSEPLFLALGLAGLCLLGAHLQRPGWLTLVGSATAIALASLVRFPGVALVFAGAVALLLRPGASLRRRLVPAAVFSCLAGVPLAIQLALNAQATGQPADRPVALHLLFDWRARTGLVSLASWILPGASCCLSHVGIVAIGVPILATVLGLLAFTRRRPFPLSTVRGDTGPSPSRIAGLFAAFYVGVLALDMAWLDASQWPNSRLMTPLFLAFVVTMGDHMRRIEVGERSAPGVLRTIAGVAVVVVTLGLAAEAGFVRDARTHGLSYGRDTWRQSATMAAVRALPLDRRVYTNRPDAIRFLTNRSAVGMPLKQGFQTRRRNAAYDVTLERVLADVRLGQASIVWFPPDIGAEDFMPSTDELRSALGPGAMLADGEIFGQGR
jgi:hypothetical protein